MLGRVWLFLRLFVFLRVLFCVSVDFLFFFRERWFFGL